MQYQKPVQENVGSRKKIVKIIRACLRSCHAPAGLKDTRKWMRFWIQAKSCGLSFGVLGLPAYPLSLNLSLLNSRHGVPKYDPEGSPADPNPAKYGLCLEQLPATTTPKPLK